MWLEGALGLRDTFIANNTVIDDLAAGGVDVASYARNVTCRDNLFVEKGSRTKPAGCGASAE